MCVSYAALLLSSGLPFDGALVAGSSAVAWLARDSSKPGRVAPGQGGCGEAWVVHATPGWSNSRALQPHQQVRPGWRGIRVPGVDPAAAPAFLVVIPHNVGCCQRQGAGVYVRLCYVLQALREVGNAAWHALVGCNLQLVPGEKLALEAATCVLKKCQPCVARLPCRHNRHTAGRRLCHASDAVPNSHVAPCANCRAACGAQVARELLSAFCALLPPSHRPAGLKAWVAASSSSSSSSSSPGEGPVLYCEAHRWDNAYPLNARAPQPLPRLPRLVGACMVDSR
jgi:hypothetical protein